MKISEYRKAVVAAIGTVVTLVVSALDVFELPGTAAGWAATVVAFLTAVGVYLTANAATIDALDGPANYPGPNPGGLG